MKIYLFVWLTLKQKIGKNPLFMLITKYHRITNLGHTIRRSTLFQPLFWVNNLFKDRLKLSFIKFLYVSSNFSKLQLSSKREMKQTYLLHFGCSPSQVLKTIPWGHPTATNHVYQPKNQHHRHSKLINN